MDNHQPDIEDSDEYGDDYQWTSDEQINAEFSYSDMDELIDFETQMSTSAFLYGIP